MDDDTLLTLTEAAQQLGSTYTALYRAAREGRLPAVLIGRLWMVESSQVKLYLDSRPARWQQQEKER